jgi:hypothetical protein
MRVPESASLLRGTVTHELAVVGSVSRHSPDGKVWVTGGNSLPCSSLFGILEPHSDDDG